MSHNLLPDVMATQTTFNAPLNTPQQYSAGQLVNQLLVFHQYSKVYQQWTQWQEKEERKMSSNIDTKCPHSPSNSLDRLRPPTAGPFCMSGIICLHCPHSQRNCKKKKRKGPCWSLGCSHGLLHAAPWHPAWDAERRIVQGARLHRYGIQETYFLLAILSRSGVYYWRRRD